MVGWNVAATQLVAERVLYKISNLVYFTSATVFTVNDYDEHVECLYECMLLPLCMINNHVCMFQFKAFCFSILCTYMFMGQFAQIFNVMVTSSSLVGGLGTLHQLTLSGDK